MPHPHSVGVFVGSLRKGAFSRQIAEVLRSIAPPSLVLEIIEIGGLPLYDADLDEDVTPYAWAQFRQAVAAVDAVLFVTPEYNRSVPAALKNALDVASRPHGSNYWCGKPGAVISSSPSAIDGFCSNSHLRQSLDFLDVPTLQQPEVCLDHVDRLSESADDLGEDSVRMFLKTFLDAFAGWIVTNTRA